MSICAKIASVKQRKGFGMVVKQVERMGRLFSLGILFILLGLVACLEPSRPLGDQENINEPTSSMTLPIIGGKPDLRHPGVGALTLSKNPFCTGTLIASKVVLTAAHCIDAAKSRSRQGKLLFRIDVPNPKSPSGFDSKYYEMETNLLTSHPNWNQNVSKGFDVGLVILKQKVPSTVAKVIPYNSAPLVGDWKGKEPLFLGYGLIQSKPSAISPKQKYGTTIPIIGVTKDRFEHRASGKSVCHGDSGGPALFLFGRQLRVFGVNSYVTGARVPGTNRSACDASGVSMRTDAFHRYIRSVLDKHGDGPATCKDNNDCGACGVCGAKNKCEPKSFPPAATFCRPCKTNSDCGKGACHRFEHGFRCLQPCNADGCCPSDSVCTPIINGSKQWHCAPKSGVCTDFPCKTNTDCGLGESCQTGVCRPNLPPRSPKLCHSCSSVHDCDSPKHLCYGPKGHGQCLQPCGDGDFCPKGFGCKQLYPGTPKQCVPDSGNCQILCKLNSDCAGGFVCDKGFCGRSGGGKEGEPCDPMACQSGLQCVKTLGGKRCMKGCGVPRGHSGSLCNDNKKCSDGSTCYAFSQNFNVCLNGCKSSADCAKSGGGQCYQGLCFCRSSSSCDEGFSCNTTTRNFGACVKSGLSQPCGAGSECRSFDEGAFCVPKGGGVRSLGERCDSLNRCNEGLVCVGTETGAICLEDCTQTQRCKLGGSCLQYGRTLSICLCNGQSTCPAGRTCLKGVIQGYGYCEAQGQKPSCISNSECPPAHSCKAGTCIPNPPPVKENPPIEPVVPQKDAGPEPSIPEEPSKPELRRQPPEKRNPPSDTGTLTPKPKPKPDKQLKPPTQGCGCSTNGDEQQAPISLLFLFLGLFFIRRRAF